jgi:hypothetical protein
MAQSVNLLEAMTFNTVAGAVRTQRSVVQSQQIAALAPPPQGKWNSSARSASRRGIGGAAMYLQTPAQSSAPWGTGV